MLRWLIRTTASVGKKNKCQAGSTASKDSLMTLRENLIEQVVREIVKNKQIIFQKV